MPACEPSQPASSARASTCASGSARAAATPARRSRSGSARSSTGCGARPLRHRVPPEGEPLERHGRAAARDPAPLRRARRLRGAARRASPSCGARARPPGRPRRRRSSPSSSSTDGRQAPALESETFRALLEERPRALPRGLAAWARPSVPASARAERRPAAAARGRRRSRATSSSSTRRRASSSALRFGGW